MDYLKKWMIFMKKNNIGLLIQVELITLLAIFLIISIFINKLITVVELSASLTLIIMAYNNYKIFNKKKMSLIYLITGLVFLIISVIDYTQVL